MSRNDDLLWMFRFTAGIDIFLWIKKEQRLTKPSNLWVELFQYDKGVEAALVSYGKTIARRRRCKENECNDCPNKFRCFGEKYIIRIGDGRIEEIYEEKEIYRIKYIVTDTKVPIKKLADLKMAKNIQRHIRLIKDMLSVDRNQELLKRLNEEKFFPHPSTIYPIVEKVDCWANEVAI